MKRVKAFIVAVVLLFIVGLIALSAFAAFANSAKAAEAGKISFSFFGKGVSVKSEKTSGKVLLTFKRERMGKDDRYILEIPNIDIGRKQGKAFLYLIIEDKDSKKKTKQKVSSGRISACPGKANRYFIRWREVSGVEVKNINKGAFSACQQQVKKLALINAHQLVRVFFCGAGS